MSGAHLSKEFFELVKSIGESKSKQEEDQIIVREIQQLKQKMAARNVPAKKMREYLLRMIYCEMLGHDASFGHIQAITMTQQKTLMDKRVGYAACSLVLHPNHDLMLLLVGSLQTDMQSDNHLEVATALIVLCKLGNAEMIPAVLPILYKLLAHPQANVRKKAVMSLQRLLQIDREAVTGVLDKAKRILCDKNPSVMGASLHLLFELAKCEPQQCKDLVPSFVSILKQITEHRLPRDYDYHRMPAPWIQLKLLQVLSVLGASDKAVSEGMYEVLHEVMRRADVGINIGYAIIYECIRTITAIYPNNALLEEAAKCTSRFITSDNHNLKYMGVNALAMIVQINSRFAAQHQLVVIDCLEDPDETLRRKTLDLLFRMTNPANVEVVVSKLTKFLNSTTDQFLRKELVSKITQLAEQYAPSNAWYIHTMITVFELGGDLVTPEVADNLVRLIAEGAANSEDEDIGQYAVDTFLKLLEKPLLPVILLRVIGWTLGEFGQRSNSATVQETVHHLFDIMDRPMVQQGGVELRSWCLGGVLKLMNHVGQVTPEILEGVEKFVLSASCDVQQRAHEFLELTKNPSTMRTVLPSESFDGDVMTDSRLSFLDAYVQQAQAAGAPAYNPPNELEDDEEFQHSSSLLTEAYEKPQREQTIVQSHSIVPTTTATNPNPNSTPSVVFNPTGALPNVNPSSPVSAATSELGLNVPSGQRKWGKKKEATPPPPPPAPPSSDSMSPTSSPYPTQAQQPIQTRPVAPTTSAPKTRKQREAEALFAGFGGAGSAKPRGVTRKSAPKPRVAAPVHAVPPAMPKQDSLLELNDLMGCGRPKY